MSVGGIIGLILLASLPIPLLAAAYWHVRVYSLYRLLGERVGNLSYYWFSLQFQTPGIARLYPGYVDLFSSLPEDLAVPAAVVRRDMRREELIVMCWMRLLVVPLIVISLALNRK